MCSAGVRLVFGRSQKRRHFAKKLLQIEEADARTRTADPFITSEVLYQLSYVGGPTDSTARPWRYWLQNTVAAARRWLR